MLFCFTLSEMNTPDKIIITIRDGVPEDASLIALVLAMSLGGDESNPLFPMFVNLAGREDTQYSYRNALVAEVEGVAAGAIVGYDGGRLHELRRPMEEMLRDFYGEDFKLEEETSAGEFYLDSVAILPRFRGMGIGQFLIEKLRDRAFAGGFDKMGLLVDFENPGAEALYTSLGFKRVNRTTFLGHDMWHLQAERDMELIIGGYGDKIYRATFNTCSETLTIKGRAKAINASHVMAKGDNIYTFSESGENSKVYSFKSLPDGEMSPLSEIGCAGADPCFAMVSDDEKWFLTADYSGGSVSLYPIENGSLGECVQKLVFDGRGPHPRRQTASHVHQVKWIPIGRRLEDNWLLATDLGTDRIHLVKMDKRADGVAVLEHIYDIDAPAGSGPRHMEFNAKGSRLYCLTELSGEILVYSVSWKGGKPEFEMLQRVVADETDAGGSADIHLHPSGKYLYTSHRLKNDGISIFRVLEDGLLEKVGYTHTMSHPRSFMITDDGRHILVASKDHFSIQVFRIGGDGLPLPTDNILTLSPDAPTSVVPFCR